MDPRELNDEDLGRLLRAVHAEADPALWTRARARLSAGAEPGLLGWLMRPVALAGSAAVLLAATVATVAVLRNTIPATFSGAGGLTEALIGANASPLDGLAAGSSGEPAPADSDALQ